MSPAPRTGNSAPAARGALLALGAALLFGASTPLLQRLAAGVGSFATASLLYAGSAFAGGMLQRPIAQEARLGWPDAGRLLLVALLGAGIGPVALVWGLHRTGAASASLMLTLEAVFTALLARMLYRESMDRRVRLAMILVTLGAMMLVIDQASAGTARLAGILGVAVATVAWAMDNVLSRPLASRDPGQVVLAKSTVGALATALLATAASEGAPPYRTALGLLAIGAVGYGVSLRLYLLAQRSFGAARTSSVFSLAPFAGALIAFALGERGASGWMLAGAGTMLAGLALHLTERHSHEHLHAAIEHEHLHSHDDGHHDHGHAVATNAPHNHRHRHAAVRHTHPHVPDEHHTHLH